MAQEHRRRERTKARAATTTLEDLVHDVLQGRIRVPVFQRPLRWTSKDVLELFDSVYRGFPIGSLMFYQGSAQAETVQVGPVMIDAPENPAALWIVDGQQRITALTAGLARQEAVPESPIDPYVVYFDVANGGFTTPTRNRSVPDTWVPVPELLDAARLNEWVFGWCHKDSREWRKDLFEAGQRIREYSVPTYVVESDDQELMRQVFYRINHFGKSLKWEDVHDALFGHQAKAPSSIAELSEVLGEQGMGQPDRGILLRCVTASRGLDPTRNLDEHVQRNSSALEGAVASALPAIRISLSFLRRNARIPHLRLLPKTAPWVVLARFFTCFPDPQERVLELLQRWVWRVFASPRATDDRALLRLVTKIGPDDEEAAVQALLRAAPSEQDASPVLGETFDPRAAESRLALCALAWLEPRSLKGALIPVASAINEFDKEIFRRVVPTVAAPENTLLIPGDGPIVNELTDHVRRFGPDTTFLQSHAISPAAAEALLGGDSAGFLKHRRSNLEDYMDQELRSLAMWGSNDRPTIAYLIERGRNQ